MKYSYGKAFDLGNENLEFYLGLNTNGNELGFETYRNGNSSYIFIESVSKSNFARTWKVKKVDENNNYCIYTEEKGRLY